MTQKTPAQLRAEAEEALKAPGTRRLKAKTKLDQCDEALKPFIKQAVEMEVPFRRITEMTGVAPNTARAWSRGASSGEGSA